MSLSSTVRIGACVAALTFAANAQIVREESMTKWVHTGTAGWTDDFSLAGSNGGKVDRLDSVKVLNYTRTITGLKKGHYVATVRIMKFKDQNGVAPLTLEVRGATIVKEQTIPFSQTTGHWIYVQSVTFTVPVDNRPILFRLYNLDATITKTNYYFDWFKLGRIPEGKVIKYQSLDYDYAPWTGAWLGNSTWFNKHVADKTSAFGEVAQPKGVWWMEHHSYYGWNKNQPKHDMILQPGTYTYNFRIWVPSTGKLPFEILHNINGLGWAKLTWSPAQQASGVWQNTPNISFKISQKDSKVRWIFRNTQSSQKRLYLLDAFLLRKGAFDILGTPCNSSVGPVNLSGGVPQVGEPFTRSVTGAPLAGIFMIGSQVVKIDLTSAGMTGCTLWTLPDIVLVAPAKNNIASLTFNIPNDVSLIGATWREQAFVPDTKANRFGGALSTLGVALIQN